MNKFYEKIDIKSLINIGIIIVSIMETIFFPYILNIENSMSYTNSIISLIVFICFIYIQRKSFVKENLKMIKNTIILAIIFSGFFVIGNKIKNFGTVNYSDFSIYLAIFSLAILIDSLLIQIFILLEKFETKKENVNESKSLGFKRYLIVFLIILICYIPVFFAAYPGYFCYDTHAEFLLYSQNIKTLWQPLIHILLVGFTTVELANAVGSVNLAIAIYTAFQMSLIAMCFTYCIYFLEKYKVSKIIRNIAVLYYAVFPVISIFAICTVKDSIFSSLVLTSIIIVIDSVLNREAFLKSKWKQLIFGVIVFLAIIYRNNAIYAYIPFLIAFFITLKDKRALIWLTTALALYFIYVGPVYYMAGMLTEDPVIEAEPLSVPLQQIARVYNYNYESLEEEELEKIYKYTSKEIIEKYLPENADPVKFDVKIKDSIGFEDFIKLWLDIGLKNKRYLF